MITRRKILKAGAIGAALATLPLVRSRQALAQSNSTFDFYISPTGDDKNPGTLASPWSITALSNNVAAYGGKRVGLLPGTYQYGTKAGIQTTLHSLYQAITGTVGPAIAIQGGTSDAPTYIASSDASGNYSPRTATIKGADPSTGILPTTSGALLGQSLYGSSGAPVTQFGYVTIDGLVINNFTWAAIVFDGSSAHYMPGITIKNCEIAFGQNVVSNNNPAAIWLNFAQNALIQNCLIHDVLSNAAGTVSNMQAAGIIQFNNDTAGGLATNIVNCTFYNCFAISNKDGWQSLNVSYCYCGWGAFGSPYSGSSATSNWGGTIQNYLGPSGATLSFHHNIVLGPIMAMGESSQENNATVNIYNNTFYKPTGIGGLDRGICAFTDYSNGTLTGGAGTFNFWNNIVYAADEKYDGVSNSAWPGAITKLGANSGGTYSRLGTCDYNAYGSGMTFGDGFSSGQYALALTNWQALGYGWDAHSTTLSSSPFSGTPSEALASSFAVTGSVTTAGKGGVPCGAVDGTGLVGCDFVGQPVPSAPVLTLG